MGRYDGWVLYSDVDGTLMTSQFEVPARNLEALRAFTREGGRFALATGRGQDNTGELASGLYVNAPCVILNGSGVYDYQAEQTLMELFLPPKARGTLEQITCEWPEIRAVIWCGGTRYDVGARTGDNFGCVEVATFNELAGRPWQKAIFTLPEEQREAFARRLTELSFDGVRVTASSRHFVELLPAAASKGNAIEFLISRYGWRRDRVLAVGDYLNDFEMLSKHGLRGFCPSNAHDDIKAVCERVLCSVDDGAIAELIESL